MARRSAGNAGLETKYGSGFIRIRRALKDYPEVQFDVQEFQGGVMATFASQGSQPESETPQVTPQVGQLLAVIQGELTRQEIMVELGLKDRKHFADAYLKPALAAGQIKMTQPDKPYSRLQKYRLTQAGEDRLSRLKEKQLK